MDFRQLIKVLAEAFHVRIEMKQIGARQEAGRIGGIGPCGRELCCATWMTNFVSVSTNAARIQDISLNPQKLAGQCAKLKCCLNYEVDAYVECTKRMPSREITLETKDATFYYFKADILKGQVSYSTDKNFAANLVTITGRRAFEVINMNRNGIKPDSLLEEAHTSEPKRPVDLLEQESVTRFDKTKKNKKKKKSGQGQPANNGEAKKAAAQQPDNRKTESKKSQPENKNKNQEKGQEKGQQPAEAKKNNTPRKRNNKGNRPPQEPGKKQQANPTPQPKNNANPQ